MWWLYLRVQTQWRYRTYGMGSVRTGLDYGPAIALAKELGWSIRRLLSLLQVIEVVAIEKDVERAKQSQNQS